MLLYINIYINVRHCGTLLSAEGYSERVGVNFSVEWEARGWKGIGQGFLRGGSRDGVCGWEDGGKT